MISCMYAFGRTNIIINIFLCATFFIMISGFGTYLLQSFGMNQIIGSSILALISYIVFLRKIESFAKINNIVIPILITIILIIGIIIAILGIGFVGYGFYKKLTVEEKNPIATMEVEGFGTIKIELYPDMAPNTVTNFIRLANRGVYDGLTFHRVVPDFMIQGGDKAGNGTGTPKLSDLEDNVSEDKEYCIPGEFIANGYTKNTLKHEKGVISMARSDYSQTDASLVDEGYNSAGSQFFIMTENNTSLDGLYAAFGRVIEGMDIVEKIENVKVTYRSSDLKEGQEAPKDKDGNKLDADRPINPPVIKSLRVETYGIDYGVPETNDVFDYYTWLMNTYYGQGA